MILVDSNIFIDYWKNPTKKQTDIFLHNEIAVCGVIKSELLRGANSEAEYSEINKALECFNVLTFGESDWQELARLFIKLRQKGVSIPFQDGMIAFVALKNNCPLWTSDRHFKLIQTVKPELLLL